MTSALLPGEHPAKRGWLAQVYPAGSNGLFPASSPRRTSEEEVPMPLPMALVLGVFVLVGLGALYVFGRRLAKAWLTYRGARVVVCPENREIVAVEVDARTRRAERLAGPHRPAPRFLHALAGEGGLRPGVPGPDRVSTRGLPAAQHPRRLVPGQGVRVLRPRLPRRPLARSQARPARPGRQHPRLGRLPARAGDRRARHARAGVLGLPRRGELQARAPRAADRPPAATRSAAFDGVARPARRCAPFAPRIGSPRPND